MLGAIIGDVVGSVYEFNNIRTEDFPLFSSGSKYTDDTVLTVTLADSIISGIDYKIKLKEYYNLYPNESYGLSFRKWVDSKSFKPYNSFGNGSAMRVSPIGWAYNTLEEVLQKAKESAEVTHNHPEGIKGAQAIAAAIFLARKGSSKMKILDFIFETFQYDLDLDLKELQANYRFNETCQETVPQAIFTFLISNDFEDSIKKAVSVGGDSDTLACINGAIAEAYYGIIPEHIRAEALERLDERLRQIALTFIKKYI